MQIITHKNISLPILALVFLLANIVTLQAQQDDFILQQDTSVTDTVKRKKIEILNTDIFEFVTDTTNVDTSSFASKTIRKFIGNVHFQHKNTQFYANKATQYMDVDIMVANGDVHIQKPDSFDVWADYMVYYSKEKLAKFRGNVIFQDSSAQLLTDSLNYDMNKDVGLFWGGGELITDSSTLTSEEGVYYHKKNEAYFYKNVHLTNPDFDLYSDSMRYDTEEQVAYFIAATKIINGEDVIYCNSGFYDTKNNKAQFGGNTQMSSGTTKISADNLLYDKDIGYGEASGNVIWEDTAEQITIIANYTEYKDSLSYVMATEDPLMIDITDGDTLYLSADTLITYKLPHPLLRKSVSILADSMDTKLDSLIVEADSFSTVIDSMYASFEDSNTVDLKFDSSLMIIDSIDFVDTSLQIVETFNSVDSTFSETLLGFDDSTLVSSDTLVQFDIDSLKTSDNTLDSFILDTLKIDSLQIAKEIIMDTASLDSIRIFHAFNKTKLLQGSLSGVCDSLYFSTGDSIFRLHQNPMVWVDTTQFSGDSIHMILKNKALNRILMYRNALIIHENVPTVYDQTKGKLVEGFFKDEKMTHMEIKGNGESIYFIQDDSSAFVGGNKSICSKMVIRMKKNENEVDHITFITKPEATFTPFRMVNLSTYKLEGFVWAFEAKPKSVNDIVRYQPMYEYFLQYLANKNSGLITPEEEIIELEEEKNDTVEPKIDIITPTNLD